MIQRPVIIYAMPRTRSTAVLEACRRNVQIFEPFNPEILFNVSCTSSMQGEDIVISNATLKRKIFEEYPQHAVRLNPAELESYFNRLNDKDTVSKVIADTLGDFLPARKWFLNADLNQTHDIFVLVRDLREQMFSFLLAINFGFFKSAQVAPTPIAVSGQHFIQLRKSLDSFLRFFPTNARLITFDSLPESHFDYSKICIEPQNFLDKLLYIENLDYCELQISCLLEYYMEEWNNKLQSICHE